MRQSVSLDTLQTDNAKSLRLWNAAWSQVVSISFSQGANMRSVPFIHASKRERSGFQYPVMGSF